MKHYVLWWRSHSFGLVGPFDNQDQAALWRQGEQPRDNGSPFWSTLQLADAHAPVVVSKP